MTGIHQGAWANTNRIPLEQDKPTEERSLYLHPEALGHPASLGVDYERAMLLAERLEMEDLPAR